MRPPRGVGSSGAGHTKGPLAAEFAALRVRPAQGAQLRNVRHPPGEEVWLVGERRGSGERKYYLSNPPADATLGELAATIKARWTCEQAHQQLKEELGLGHFEGRSWTGLHRHALMTMTAHAFLQQRRLAVAKRGERPAGPPPQPSLPAIRAAIVGTLLRARSPPRCPHCGSWIGPPRDRHLPK